MTPGSVFFVYLLLVLVALLIRALFHCCKPKRCNPFPNRVDNMEVQQSLASFYSSLPTRVRESLIREEVLDQMRTGCSKLSKEKLAQLVLQPTVTDKALKLVGSPSYRILRTAVAEHFNYVCPGIKGMKQTDFVISQYARPAIKMCSLDLVSSVAYLAFIDPDRAKALQFSTEYLEQERNKVESQLEEAELVS